MNIKAKLENALKEAMRAGDQVKKRTVRMALAAIKQVEIDRQVSLDEAAVLAILPSRRCAQKEIKMRRESLEEARRTIVRARDRAAAPGESPGRMNSSGMGTTAEMASAA